MGEGVRKGRISHLVFEPTVGPRRRKKQSVWTGQCFGTLRIGRIESLRSSREVSK